MNRYWFENWIDASMPFVLFGLCVMSAALVVVTIGLVVYTVYDHFVAEKFYLRKDEWKMTKWHNENRTRTILVGKVPVQQRYIETVADEYTRI